MDFNEKDYSVENVGRNHERDYYVVEVLNLRERTLWPQMFRCYDNNFVESVNNPAAIVGKDMQNMIIKFVESLR